MQGELIMNKFKLGSNNYTVIFVLCVGKTEGLWYFVLVIYLCFHLPLQLHNSLMRIPAFPRCHVCTGMEEQGVIKSRVHIAEFIYKKELDAHILGWPDHRNHSWFDGNSCSEWVWFSAPLPDLASWPTKDSSVECQVLGMEMNCLKIKA